MRLGNNAQGQLGQGNSETVKTRTNFAEVKNEAGTGTLGKMDYLTNGSGNTENAGYIGHNGFIYTLGKSDTGAMRKPRVCNFRLTSYCSRCNT